MDSWEVFNKLRADLFLRFFVRSIGVTVNHGRCLKEKLSGTNFNDWLRRLKLVLRVEKKLFVIESLPTDPAVISEANVAYRVEALYVLIMRSLNPLGQYVLKMKGYVEQLERLGYVLPQDLSVGLILNGLTSLPKKAATPQVMVIQGGRIQKANKKSQNAKGKGKGKGKGKDKGYVPQPKNPKPKDKEHSTKNDTCHHCKEVGHWKRNCPVLLGLRGARKLKQGDIYLYVGNGVRCTSGGSRVGGSEDLEEIKDEDTSPSEITSKISMEVEGFEPPQEEVILIRRFKESKDIFLVYGGNPEDNTLEVDFYYMSGFEML
ncbi:retrotransposon protein, putative, ty1-copia subclass [Tanacetum coccineum]